MFDGVSVEGERWVGKYDEEEEEEMLILLKYFKTGVYYATFILKYGGSIGYNKFCSTANRW